jgi:hypothetical protein
MKIKVTLALVAGWAAGAFATSYLGSVVNSWNGVYRIGNQSFAPFGFCYGEVYLYVHYDGFLTKREPNAGSIVDIIGVSGPMADDIGFEPNTEYLYCACYKYGVYIRDSYTGSDLASFPPPPGASYATGLCYDRRTPAKPIWLSDINTWRIWNLTTAGSVANSITVPLSSKAGLAFDGDTTGGPFIFVATTKPPASIYAVNAVNGSICYSFAAPVPENKLWGLTWDGEYLWTINAKACFLMRFIAHEPYLTVLPASVGRIRALFH